MALKFDTKTPKRLLAAFKKAVDDGHVRTWTYDTDGDFTHSPEQWMRRAWLRPKVIDGVQLKFIILAPIETKLSSEIYAVYHGRFIESMLAHCDTLFTSAVASALPEPDDVVQP